MPIDTETKFRRAANIHGTFDGTISIPIAMKMTGLSYVNVTYFAIKILLTE